MKKPARGEEPWRSSKAVSLAGLLTDIRKRGNRVTMFLDDGQDRIELTMFSEGFQQYRHLIEEHAARVISGKIRYDDFIDGWRVAVDEIKDIDRVIEQRASHLTIHWLQNGKSGMTSAALQEILAPFRPGRCGVELYYQNDDAQARLPLGDAWRVRPSGELRDKLAETVGVSAFRFAYEKRSSG